MLRKCWFFLLVVLLVVLLCGCSYFDKKAFKNAKVQNTEEAYQEYIREYPDGRYVAEAKKWADWCAFSTAQSQNTIEAYENYLSRYSRGLYVENAQTSIQQIKEATFRNLATQALSWEKKREWAQALALWQAANKVLPHDRAKKHIETCQHKIDNPVEIVDEKVVATYRYSSFDPNVAGRQYRSVRVTGKVVNNLSKPVYNIVICLSVSAKKVLTINTTTGEDYSRGGNILLDSVKRTICADKGLLPGETRRFSFRASISADVGLTKLDGSLLSFLEPETIRYSIRVDSHKVAD